MITATSNHPFWEMADHNWTEASQLTLDDILFNIQENNTSISSLKSYSQNAIVYNLTVANDHTYFVGVGGVLGHNAGCGMPTQKTWDHIFYGDLKNGELTGIHHFPSARMYHGSKFGVIKNNKGSRMGFYQGRIIVNGVWKEKASTFFQTHGLNRILKE